MVHMGQDEGLESEDHSRDTHVWQLHQLLLGWTANPNPNPFISTMTWSLLSQFPTGKCTWPLGVRGLTKDECLGLIVELVPNALRGGSELVLCLPRHSSRMHTIGLVCIHEKDVGITVNPKVI